MPSQAASVSALLLGLTTCASAALYDQVIQNQYGPIQGYAAFNSSFTGNLTHWKDITVWKGIPFAATTAGENRFKPPQPVTGWTETFNASSWGDICPDSSSSSSYTVSEDCLSLNIWSAANSTDAKLPVVMWSYPGLSTAADALFDGGGMADQGIVYVNYNYRASSFGWLALPELSEERYEETGYNSSGNWGMLDQFAALQWIYENIANFGGDPNHITVMGQSSGSAATYHILNSPLTKGLIKGAIIESGVRDPQDPLCTSLAESYTPLNESLQAGKEFMASLNVTTLAELRALPMEDLESSPSSPGSIEFTATLDGYAMPATYYDTLVQGLAHNVPIITGNTKDESGAAYGLNITVDTYLSDFNSTFSGEWLDKFLALYPADNDTAASGAVNSQWTDRSKVGTWLWTQMWLASNVTTAPVYNYYWDHAPPGMDQGAYHESEINYVLNNLYDTDLPWEEEDYNIARQMNGYWANFIKTGDPNGEGLTTWDPVNSSQLVQHVGDGWGAIQVAPAAKIELFKAWFATLEKY